MKWPKVSIIVTSYLPESKRYLDICVRSIRNISYPDFETIIVGRPDYLPAYPGIQTVSPPQKAFWNCVGLNYGVGQASAEAEFYFLINDDTILTKNCLQPLVTTLKSQEKIGQVMPIGNDQQGRYFFPMFPGHITLKDVPWDQLPGIMNLDSPYPQGLILADTLCLYAQLISRRVWCDVGPFDEALQGQDDIDYSLRINQKDYINAIELSSLVWHFGGVSAALTLTDEKRIEAHRIFNKKWGKSD